MSTPYCVVYITAPPGIMSKKIANVLLKARLAACVNIIPHVESRYWWKGKLESARESLLVIKTRKALLPSLQKTVRRVHPYTVPEIISLPIESGNSDYLGWLGRETKA